MKEKRSTKAKSKQLAQVTIVAKSLVCDASLALGAVGALRLHATNKQIPLISTLTLFPITYAYAHARAYAHYILIVKYKKCFYII